VLGTEKGLTPEMPVLVIVTTDGLHQAHHPNDRLGLRQA